jgi:hypothetical protein
MALPLYLWGLIVCYSYCFLRPQPLQYLIFSGWALNRAQWTQWYDRKMPTRRIYVQKHLNVVDFMRTQNCPWNYLFFNYVLHQFRTNLLSWKVEGLNFKCNGEEMLFLVTFNVCKSYLHQMATCVKCLEFWAMDDTCKV